MKKILVVLLSLVMAFASTPANALNTPNGEGVFIVPGSDINLVARTSNIPVQIENAFNSEVTVHVHVQPTNPRIVVPASVAVTIPALTSVTAKVPVEAVANGEVMLKVWLTTFSGQKLGGATFLQMNVNADIEFAMLAGFASVVALLLIFGIVRTIRKKRRA